MSKKKAKKKATPIVAQESLKQEVDVVDESQPTLAQATKDAELANLREENAKLKAPKGIPTAVKKDANGLIIRPDAKMATDLAVAVVKDTSEYTDDDRICIEREIRRYVKKGGAKKDPVSGHFLVDHKTGGPVKIKGGWRKGITEAQKARAVVFLTRLGRDTVNPEWDESIVVPGF